jgi:hypothetical protein
MDLRGVRTFTRMMALLMSATVAACQSTGAGQPSPAALEEATCPDGMQDQIAIAGSAVPVVIPEELANVPGTSEHGGLIARRVIVSIAPKSMAVGARVFSSALTMTSVGGVFAGWAALAQGQERVKALDIIPGRLRIQPFLNSKSLQAQTMTVDVLVKPGSTPLDELAITTTPLWNDAQHPVRPEDLRLTLAPVRHMTVFDVVDARLTLTVTAVTGRHGNPGLWRCSFENRLELIDRASVLPDLWGLRKTGFRGSENEWLALDDPTTGPFRAVFANPEAARGFTDWLRVTHATRIDKYALGLFSPEAPDIDTPPAINRAVAVPFHAISPKELEVLDVKRLGE